MEVNDILLAIQERMNQVDGERQDELEALVAEIFDLDRMETDAEEHLYHQTVNLR